MITLSAKRRCIAVALGSLIALAGTALTHSLGASAPVYAARIAAQAAAQDSAQDSAVLTVEGASPTPLLLTAANLAKMPRSTATLPSDGATDTYEGVLLYDILIKAGWKYSHSPAAKSPPVAILATAKDGFQAVFSPGEIDPQLSGQKVLVADKLNGLPIPDRYKPFRLVTPQDKAHARSIYSLVKLQVIKLPQ